MQKETVRAQRSSNWKAEGKGACGNPKAQLVAELLQTRQRLDAERARAAVRVAKLEVTGSERPCLRVAALKAISTDPETAVEDSPESGELVFFSWSQG